MPVHSYPRFFAPEVIQTSAMDCGPATLHCLLQGFGIASSYGRLREACQTDIDGTSIDTLEDLARQFGLESEQIMLPSDHLFLPDSQLLPAIAVVRLPTNLTHFLVLWRRHGSWIQIMDPSTGRRWLPVRRLLNDLYLHSQRMTASAWREWAGSEAFVNPLRHRLDQLGVPQSQGQQLIQTALADAGWHSLGALDAATRLTKSLTHSGAIRRGPEAGRMIAEILRKEEKISQKIIPSLYWSVEACPIQNPEQELELIFRGVLLVSVPRRSNPKQTLSSHDPVPVSGIDPILQEAAVPMWRKLSKLLWADGWWGPAGMVVALLVAAGGVIGEALLLRSLFELTRKFVLIEHRLLAMGVLIAFVTMMFGLNWGIAQGALRLGRRLEVRLRMAFLEKIPRLGDRYFHSRLLSDMAERLHVSHTLRSLPQLGGQWLRTFFELAFTVAGITWLDPALASKAILLTSLALILPFFLQPWLSERDMRWRIHGGALSRFFLDALTGLVAIRAHGSERILRREHDHLLKEWVKAGAERGRAALLVQGMQGLLGCLLASVLLFSSTTASYDPSNLLLLVYWILNLPLLAGELTSLAEQYAMSRNITLRLLEPLDAPEQVENRQSSPSNSVAESLTDSGCFIQFENVTVRAGGQVILKEISLEIAGGAHVAIVGPSGAGKSSLLGALLGWHRPSRGQILVDHCRLEADHQEKLRAETAWVDPAIQIWNQSLEANLIYGISPNHTAALPISEVLENIKLHRILQKLPNGLQTALGEGGGLLSGGEGQQVRLARAWLRPGVRLVLLDEPFHGLDREDRAHLIEQFRQKYRHLTFLCILHDLDATLQFDRILMMEKGKIIEDGSPRELAQTANSRYREMLESEKRHQETLWSPRSWRQARIHAGQWVEFQQAEENPWNS